MSDQHADTFTRELGYLAAGLTQSASTPAAAKWAIDRIEELRVELLSAIRQRDGLNAEVGATLNRLQMAHEELSAAQAEVAKLKEDAESNAWTVSPAMAQAKIDELNALLVTARAELAEYRQMHDGNPSRIHD